MKKKTGEKSPTKLRQISVGVYLDAETSKRFTLAVRKEQDKTDRGWESSNHF